MEEIQTQSQTPTIETIEPAEADNSLVQEMETTYCEEEKGGCEGQSGLEAADPSCTAEQLILGKFKSVEELSKAYEELQRHQGACSEELGELRKSASAINQIKETWELFQKYQNGYLNRIREDQEKYNGPEYFQDPTFREMYGEAFKVFGEDLDTDRMVNLLETYVASRVAAIEKKKAAKLETETVLDSMSYSKNPKSSFTPPKKRIDEMTQQEIDALLDRLI